jgi:crotonobetainyl-CoA:carnitine CoA-transferase CaiB-like acyl-CoA transferase
VTGALDGVRVIDFGQYIAGPLAAMLLADQGADVIRVDPPGGPRFDTPANQTWNRGKRSIVLDLKQPGDLDIARQFVESSDVLVENFRPGVMDRLGLGATAMLSSNPCLVYCSLPGFASDDPRAALPAWEGIVGAATRTYPLDGDTGRPVYTAVPISSCYAAFQGVVSIAMALNARERDGAGQRIEVPLFDATFAAIGSRALRINGRPPPPRDGVTLRWSRQHECKDGRWVQLVTGNLRFRAFLEAVGADGWADDEGTEPQIEAVFRARTAQEWEAFAELIGTEIAVCRTSAEWLDSPHARGSKIVVEAHDPKLGVLVQPGINVRLSATPGAIRSPAPKLDAHRAELLGALSARPAPKPSHPAEPMLRAALDGVKVLDLCIILAGPTCGRTLAEFGADVIKIDNPGRDPIASHNDVNRGKRSLLLDLKTEEGLSVFWRLLQQADVVVQNYRKGIVDRLGIGYEQMRARRPDIVYASLNAFGHVGPWAGRPGHEQLAQAVSGMQDRYGDGRPVLQPFPVNDYGTGFMGAYAVALALLHRRRTGQGQHVDTALAYTASILQSPFLQSYTGKEWNEPRGQDALGSSPLHRAYRASDGWLFLGTRPSDLLRLDGIEGMSGVGGLSGAELVRALEERIAAASIGDWEKRLAAAGIGVHRVVEDLAELMDDPWVCAHGLSITREHEGIGMVNTNGTAPRLSRTQPAPGRPAPKPGSDAAAILRDIGLEGDLDRLVRNRVVALEGVSAGS